MGTGRHLLVDGKPFFMLGGQVNNSSAYTAERMAPIWDTLNRMGANTAEVPLYWEQFEPREGVYDYAMLEALLAGAREHGLKLVLLWFGAWKNGTMKYAPAWVKQQPERFRRVITREGVPVTVLSPHCRATLETDRRAVCALLERLRQLDADQGTVILLQIENEPGLQGSPRDYGAEANTLYAGLVPDELLRALPTAMRPALRAAWVAAGSHTAGTWEQVFGPLAEEVFTAWYLARYVEEIAAAGHQVYPLPTYINVWLREIQFRQAGYEYPAGGAVETMIDVWKAAAPTLYALAPDIYWTESAAYRRICAAYDRPDNPLLIPECGPNPSSARLLFYAIAEHGAVGVAPFGIDHWFDEQGQVRPEHVAFTQSIAALRALLPLIPRYQGSSALHAIVQEEDATEQYIDLDGFAALVQFGSGRFGRPQPSAAPGAERGRGLLIQTGPKEFYVTGCGFTVYLRPKTGFPGSLRLDAWLGRLDPYLLVEAGCFEGDEWVVAERRAGDESDLGLMMTKPGQAVHAIFE